MHTYRPHRMVRLAAVAAAGLMLVPAAAAGAATTPTPSASGQKVTFTIGMLSDVDSLNPFTGIVAESYEVWNAIYDTLMSYSAKDFSPVGLLATSWKSSPDGKTWTYTIHSGVKWSDGVPLTSADVKYTYDRIIKGSYEQTNWGNYVAPITSVDAPNPTTVVMHTKTPAPIMLNQAVPILPQHVWSKIDENAVKSYKNEVNVVGSGPFKLIERRVGQFIRLEANPNYYGGPPKFDELVYRVYRNADAMAQALKTGEISFGDNFDAPVWEALKKAPGVKVVSGKYPEFDQLAFNTGAALDDGTPIGDGHPALKDKRVRVALSYAIDRKVVLDRVLNGEGTVGTTIIPPTLPALHLEPANPYTFDPAKANQLLDQAGYKKGPDGVRTMPDGSRPLKFRLFARQESQPSQQAVRLVASWFNAVGVATEVKVVAEDNLTELLGQGKFDMSEWGWIADPNADYMLSVMTCAKRSYKDAGQVYANLSDSFYCNPAYDALYAKQATQADPAQRAQTVKEMQQMVYDDAPYAVLYYYNDLQAYSDKWTGFVEQPADGGVVLFQYGAWSYTKIDRTSRAGAAAAASATETGSGGGTTLVWVILAVMLLLGALFGGLWFSRRRGGDRMDVE
jgi:peptide/nickel transport system substrate-binding protein